MKGIYLKTRGGNIYIPPFKVDTVGDIEEVEGGFTFQVYHGNNSTLVHMGTLEEAQTQRDLIIQKVEEWYIKARNVTEHEPSMNTQISHMRSRVVVHGLERL